MGRPELAQQALQKAGVVDTPEDSAPIRNRRNLPLFQVTKTKRLISGADPRLAEALREDALGAFKVTSH